MPDYELKKWDDTNFDCDAFLFAKEALANKKYAFVADCIRLYALYHEGGFYLDTDVMVLKSFDPLTQYKFVGGTEAFDVQGEIHYRLEAAIMGSEKGNPFIKECLDYYQQRQFCKNDGTFDLTVIQAVISDIAQKRGYQFINSNQVIGNDLNIFSTSTFSNNLCFDSGHKDTLFAIHQNEGSWIDYSNRGWLFHFCRKHNLMDIYKKMENLRK